ncbi:recombinase family protein [Candidatus Margulisiibacteriota bacterium]
MTIHKTYTDGGYSGANIDRPALTELLNAIYEGKVNFVIVYKIDRLTRSPKDFYHLIEIFEQNNVSFISVTERFDTSTPSGRLLRNIMLTFAQFERELASERTKDKMLERAKKGLFGGGACPFGYKRIDKKLVIESKEAQIIRRIFDLYVETGSLYRTFSIVNQEGLCYRKNRTFTIGDLANILRKVVYTGKIFHQGEIYQGIHEAIISDEQFEQARQIHKNKPFIKNPPAKHFLFPGMVTCQECGSTMTSCFTNKIRKKQRKRYFFYQCVSTKKSGWNACSIRQVSAKRLELSIVESLERIAKDPFYLESLSFKLENQRSGGRQGYELCLSKPDFSPQSLKPCLQNIVRIASSKGGLNKELAIKKHIKNIIYSKEAIEIKLYLPAGKAGAPNGVKSCGDAKNAKSGAKNSIKTIPPLLKMDGGIFGRPIGEKIATIRELEKVRTDRKSGG